MSEKVEVLSELELEILRLIALEGLDNKEIIDRLQIPVKVVRESMKNIRRNTPCSVLRISFAVFYVESGLDISPLAGRGVQWNLLCEQEKQIAALLASGMTSGQIGDELGWSQAYISSRIQTICVMLCIASFTQIPALVAGLELSPNDK